MEPKSKPDRQARHAELYETLSNDLSHAVDNLEGLKVTISGEPRPTDVAEKCSGTPAASQVYANAPGEIREFSKRICVLTSEIREMVL